MRVDYQAGFDDFSNNNAGKGCTALAGTGIITGIHYCGDLTLLRPQSRLGGILGTNYLEFEGLVPGAGLLS